MVDPASVLHVLVETDDRVAVEDRIEEHTKIGILSLSSPTHQHVATANLGEQVERLGDHLRGGAHRLGGRLELEGREPVACLEIEPLVRLADLHHREKSDSIVGAHVARSVVTGEGNAPELLTGCVDARHERPSQTESILAGFDLSKGLLVHAGGSEPTTARVQGALFEDRFDRLGGRRRGESQQDRQERGQDGVHGSVRPGPPGGDGPWGGGSVPDVEAIVDSRAGSGIPAQRQRRKTR